MCSWTDLCLTLSHASKEEKRDHRESRWSQCNKMHFVVLNGYFQSGYEVFLTNHAARLNPLTVHVSVSAVIAIFRFATMQFGSWHKRREKRSVAKLIFSWISALLSSCPPQCSSSCFLHSFHFFPFSFPSIFLLSSLPLFFLICPSYLLASSPLCFLLHFLLTSLLIHHLILLVSSFSFPCIFFLLTFSSPSLFISLFLISLSFLLSFFSHYFHLFVFVSHFLSLLPFFLCTLLFSSFYLFCLFHVLMYCCLLFLWSFNALVFVSSSPQCSRFWSHVPVHHRGCRLSQSVQTRDCAERQQYPSKQHHTGNK